MSNYRQDFYLTWAGSVTRAMWAKASYADSALCFDPQPGTLPCGIPPLSMSDSYYNNAQKPIQEPAAILMDIIITPLYGLDWLPPVNSIMKRIGSTVDFFAALNWEVWIVKANSGHMQ